MYGRDSNKNMGRVLGRTYLIVNKKRKQSNKRPKAVYDFVAAVIDPPRDQLTRFFGRLLIFSLVTHLDKTV